MCLYFLMQPLCAHHSTLLAGPSCRRVLEELNRIHEDPSAWTTEGRHTLPFTWPDECLPHAENIRVMETGEWCGWECRNSHCAFGPGPGGVANDNAPSVMGMPGATYGTERMGVGWRNE